MRTLSRRTRWFIWAAAAVLVCGLSFLFDGPVLTWVETHEFARLAEVMNVVSRLGDWPLHVIAGFVGAVVAYFCGRRDWTRILLAMIAACIIAGLFARVVKIGAGRARPSAQTDVGWNGPRLRSKYNAFPSGHVTSSAAFFGVLVFASRRRATAAVLIVPAVIGFSRIYVGAHHFSDVVCAAALGLFVAWLLARPPILARRV